MNLLEQLIYFYYVYDKFQETYMSEEEAKEYHQVLIDKNRVHYVIRGKVLLGYGESWRINFEQLGKILCCLPFNIKNEDIESGQIAYLANVTIHPEYRGSDVLRELRNQFFRSNYDCEFFVGHAKRKKTQPWKVFSKQEAFKKWAYEGVI